MINPPRNAIGATLEDATNLCHGVDGVVAVDALDTVVVQALLHGQYRAVQLFGDNIDTQILIDQVTEFPVLLLCPVSPVVRRDAEAPSETMDGFNGDTETLRNVHRWYALTQQQVYLPLCLLWEIRSTMIDKWWVAHIILPPSA